MERQLMLLEVEPADWKLDDHTREVGREGLALARAALQRARAAARDEQPERSAA